MPPELLSSPSYRMILGTLASYPQEYEQTRHFVQPNTHLSLLAVLITALPLHTPYFARPGTKAALSFPPRVRTSGIKKRKEILHFKAVCHRLFIRHGE